LSQLGATVGRENDGPSKSRGIKMQDMKMQDLTMLDTKIDYITLHYIRTI